MTVWILEPVDPLIARDGRPFSNDPGARAASLPFPYPSTTTGAVRTLAGLKPDGVFDTGKVETVKQIAVRGPLLARADDKGDWSILAPAPADAVAHDVPNADPPRITLIPCGPRKLDENTFTNLPSGLLPIGFKTKPESQTKVSSGAPRYWRWDHFERWLLSPVKATFQPEELGIAGPQSEVRTHVAIDPETQTAKESHLFQTQGLEFTTGNHLSAAGRLALVVASDAGNISDGVSPLGGERRLTAWRKGGEGLLPQCPPEVRQNIAKTRCCRVVLLTPGVFDAGFLPKQLLAERFGVVPTLTGVACHRYQTVSGWDFESRKPKPTRRLVPAGSVYFLSLGDSGEIDRWIDAMWMQCVSDNEQDRRDGFGLAVLGTWEGVEQ